MTGKSLSLRFSWLLNSCPTKFRLRILRDRYWALSLQTYPIKRIEFFEKVRVYCFSAKSEVVLTIPPRNVPIHMLNRRKTNAFERWKQIKKKYINCLRTFLFFKENWLTTGGNKNHPIRNIRVKYFKKILCREFPSP